MSNTNTVYAKPLYAQGYVDPSELDNIDLRGNPIPKDDTNPNPAGQDTSGVDPMTTSGSEGNEFEDRYKKLKRHHDSSIFEARQRIKVLEDEATRSARPTPPKTAEEMKQYQEKNPEMFAAMQTMTMTNENQVDPSRVQRLERELFESQQRTALEQIKQVHPDYAQTIDSPEFEAWLAQQPLMVKGLIVDNETDSAAFIRCLDLYKLDNGTSTNNGSSFKKSNNDASAADAVTYNNASQAEVGTEHGRIWTREEIGKLRPQQYEALESEIDTAYAEGRVR